MLKLLLVLVFGFVFYFVCVQGLECGITEELNRDDMKTVVGKCVPVKSEETTEKSDKNSESEEKSEENVQTYSVRRGVNTKTRKRREVNTSNDNDKMTNSTGVQEKCVLQCIFNQLGMTDGNGYPEHHSVAQGLLKNARGRELKDFLQDSTDECFQLMEQGEKADSCEYSKNLVSCLSEKGRSNCADWKFTNLPFYE